MADLSGQMIGKYRIVALLGEGGMATVYQATDTETGQNIALKMITTVRNTTPRFLKRFARETKALKRFNHPNIIRILDSGTHEGQPYLVMPYIPGGTLKQYLGKQSTPQEAAALLAPVARALQAVHDKDIIHRDVKPGNILIDTAGIPLLSDFGIAKILRREGDDPTTELTVAGMGLGTPEYMSPEQGRGLEVDKRTDIYSLGVIFYELLTGRKPFTAESTPAVIYKHVYEPLPRPSLFNPAIPPMVENVIFIALAKEPAGRYPDMASFASALEQIARGEIPDLPTRETTEPLPITPTTLTGTMTYDPMTGERLQPSPVTLPTMDPNIPAQPKNNRAKLLGIAGGMLGLAAIIAVIVLISSGGSTTSTSGNSAPVRVQATHTRTAVSRAATSAPAATAQPVSQAQSNSEQTSGADGMLLVYIPGGNFVMGSTSADSSAFTDEMPQHTVQLSSFWIDQTEVTNGMFTRFVSETGYVTDAESYGWGGVWNGTGWARVSGATWNHPQGPSSSLSGLENYPVVQVSWNDAQAYCRWAGRSLPSEAQWEAAARGTDGRLYPWGNQSVTSGMANFADTNLNVEWNLSNVNDGYQYVAPAGQFTAGASPYGVLDMAGNVWEWNQDWYGETYYSSSPQNDPGGPAGGDRRVMRGGSWGSRWRYLRCANRLRAEPDYRDAGTGFRCATENP